MDMKRFLGSEIVIDTAGLRVRGLLQQFDEGFCELASCKTLLAGDSEWSQEMPVAFIARSAIVLIRPV